MAGTTDTSLATGLVSWWSLTETSGNRADSVGANTLSESGGTVSSIVGSPPFRISRAATFLNAGTFYLRCNSNASLDLSVNLPMSLCCWVRLTGPLTSDTYTICGRAGAGLDYFLEYANFGFNPGSFRFTRGSSSLAQTTFTQPAGTRNDFSPEIGRWFLLVGRYAPIGNQSPVLGEVNLSINNGLPVGTTAVFRTSPSVVQTAGFTVGARDGGGKNLVGDVAGVGLWSRLLTNAEIGDLYRSGASQLQEDLFGTLYPFTLPGSE